MNYYIQGCAAKADKIKAAFEKLGYDTSFVQNLSASDVHILFTLPCDTRVHAFHTAYIEADILKRLVNIDPDYQELKLPVEPKFKVGDEIAWIEAKGSKPTEPVKIIRLIDKDQLYMVDMPNGVSYVAYDMQDYYKLVQKPHYDIANFYAGMPVLVRADNDCSWVYSVFSRITGNEYWKFSVCNGVSFTQCIPLNDDTKHLLGTTDMPDEMYINW